MERGAWRATVHRVAKESDTLSDFHFTRITIYKIGKHQSLCSTWIYTQYLIIKPVMEKNLKKNMYIYVYIYMYIYVYVYVCVYIYIYIYKTESVCCILETNTVL